MSVEENKVLARRFYEELNKRNLGVLDELCAANYVDHHPGGVEIHGPEELRQMMTGFFTAFPDLRFTVEDLIAEGDKVVARWTSQWTHRGDLQGIAPTGKEGATTGIAILRIVGGKLVEEWAQMDMLGMMQQIGAIPAPGQG